MVDVSDTDLAKMVRFCESQMNGNPAGIGNECTHFVYAGLFEIKANDGVLQKDSLTNTSNDHYKWGRPVDFLSARAGDIVQFTSQKQEFFIWAKDANQWRTDTGIRGPHHTAVVASPPQASSPGGFLQYECHLHHPLKPTPLMQLRFGTINYQSYALKIPKSDLHPTSFSLFNYLMSTIEQIAERNMQALELFPAFMGRSLYAISDAEALQIEKSIKSGKQPDDLGGYFRVNKSGDVKIFRPQVSAARRAMSDDDLAKEKLRVSIMMEKSGRKGHAPDEDDFGGDNKKKRIADGRFDWTFSDQPARPSFPLPPL